MTEPISTTQQVTIAVPGSQVIAVLLAGLLMAFSFQLIVAILQVITGLIALGIKMAMKLDSADTMTAAFPEDSLNEEEIDEPDLEVLSLPSGSKQALANDNGGLLSESASEITNKQSETVSQNIGFIAGLGLVIGINMALFPASFFAVKLSRVDRPILGMISGLVLWSAYFLILTWLSSQTLGAILQTVLGGVVGGVGQLLGAIASLFKRSPGVSEKKVRREIKTALANFDLDSRIQSYVKDLPPVRFDLQPVEEVLQLLLTVPAFQSVAGRQLLDTVNRDRMSELLQKQTQFSEQDIKKILDRLDPLWEKFVSQVPQRNRAAELVKLLDKISNPVTAESPTIVRDITTNSEDGKVKAEETIEEDFKEEIIASEDLGNKIVESENPETSSNPTLTNDIFERSRGASALLSSPIDVGVDISEMLAPLLDMVDADTLLDELLAQVDLSEWDVARIWQQFQLLRQQLTGKAIDPLKILPEDVENYLLAAALWELNSTVLAEDIPQLFYDPEADPEEMKYQLNLLNAGKFEQFLNQRGDLAPEDVKSFTAQLESLRHSAISQANESLKQEQLYQLGEAFKTQVETLPREEITSEKLTESLELLMEGLPSETIMALHTQLDDSTLNHWLQENTQLPSEILPAAVTAIGECVQTQASQIEAKLAEVQQSIKEIETKLTAYLTYTTLDKLTAASIRQKLQTLVEEAIVDSEELERALPHLETTTLHEILNHRHSLDSERREQMVSQIQDCWRDLMTKDREMSNNATSFAQRLTTTFEEILRSQNIEQLSLEDLKPQLLSLIRDPDLTMDNLTQELSQIDWSPLLNLMLELRFDLSQAKELLQWLEAQIYAAKRLPRRWLARLQDREKRFEKSLQRYLQHNSKDALNPELMRRDLQKILHKEVKRGKIMDTIDRTVAGINQQGEQKLPEFLQEEAIATILTQREDLTPDERTQISDSLKTTWQEITEQFRTAQQEAEAALNNFWKKLEMTVNSLKLSNLDLEILDRQLDTLLVPLSSSVDRLSQNLNLWLPDSPLAILRSRLEALNNKAIAQVVQARDDLSNKVNSYIQARLDKVRREIDRELAILEKEALQQLNQIRRGAAIAATWFLVIALSSAASSALAGLLAVR